MICPAIIVRLRQRDGNCAVTERSVIFQSDHDKPDHKAALARLAVSPFAGKLDE
jgi:hypothetical protein